MGIINITDITSYITVLSIIDIFLLLICVLIDILFIYVFVFCFVFPFNKIRNSIFIDGSSVQSTTYFTILNYFILLQLPIFQFLHHHEFHAGFLDML